MTDDLYERYKEALRVGHVAVLRGALQDALAAYRLASSIAPSRALPHTSLGGVLLRLGHLEEALVEYASAVARAPHDEGALLGQAEALTIGGQRVDAAMALDHVSEIQEAAGRLPEAADTLRRALELEEAPERIRRQRTLLRDIRLSAGDHAAEQLLARALRLREEPAGPMEMARTVVASTPVTGAAVSVAAAASVVATDAEAELVDIVVEWGPASLAALEIPDGEVVVPVGFSSGETEATSGAEASRRDAVEFVGSEPEVAVALGEPSGESAAEVVVGADEEAAEAEDVELAAEPEVAVALGEPSGESAAEVVVGADEEAAEAEDVELADEAEEAGAAEAIRLREIALAAFAGEAPAGEAPAGEAPAGEAPAGEAPAGEAPASQVDAGEAPAGEAPAGEAPASEDDGEGEPQWAIEPASPTEIEGTAVPVVAVAETLPDRESIDWPDAEPAAATAAGHPAGEAAARPEAEPVAGTEPDRDSVAASGPERESIPWPEAEPAAAVRPPRERIESPEAEPVGAVRPTREAIAWPEAEPIAHARGESASWTQPTSSVPAGRLEEPPAAAPEAATLPLTRSDALPPEVAAVIAAVVRNEPSGIGVMDGAFVTPIGMASGVVGESIHQPTGDELLAAAEAADLAGDSTTLRSLLLWTARAYAREGRFEAGLDAAHRLLQRSPSDVDAHLVLVELYVARDWNSLAADKLVLLGRLAELNNDQETRQRLGAVASRVFPQDRRLESLYH